MKLSLEDKVTKTKMTHLLQHAGVLTFVHPIIGLMLCAMFWNKVAMPLMIQWFSALMLVVLARALNFYSFQRRQSNSINLKRFENYSLAFSALNGACYSVAFCYLAMTQVQEELSTVLLIAIMLTAISSFGFVASIKNSVAFSVPIFLPLLVVLIYQQNYESYMFASILVLHAMVLFRAIKPISESLAELFELRIKSDEAERQLKKYDEKFANMTVEDTVTRIYNRRFFDLTINNEVRRAKRMSNDLCIALVDIDCFREYNDHYGKEAGDRCLGAVAGTLKNSVHRGGEFVTRFEEDKFGIILPNVKAADAERFLLRLQDIVLKSNIEHKASKVTGLDRISVSAGICEFTHGHPLERKDVISRAQIALAKAKELGKCTIVVYSEELRESGRKSLSVN